MGNNTTFVTAAFTKRQLKVMNDELFIVVKYFKGVKAMVNIAKISFNNQ